MTDPKPLLFIHNDQAQVLELDVFRENAVRADQDIDLALFNLLCRRLVLLRRAEAAHHLDHDWKSGKAALEIFEVLEDQDRCRSEHGDLFVILYGLERGPHGNLGLAVTHIAA